MALPEHLIISTDFDGTLTSPEAPDLLAPDLMDWLEEARRRRKVTWIINTGRCWPTLSAELIRRQSRFWPDWVVLMEREIHRVESRHPLSLEPWNSRCLADHRRLFAETAAVWEKMRLDLGHFPSLQMVKDVACPLGLIAHSEDQADEIELLVTAMISAHSDLICIRNSIYFRFGHRLYSKGSCLREIAARENASALNCFAAGDHYNDLSMLRQNAAAFLCCPHNSAAKVKSQVAGERGYISQNSYNAGTTEGLRHFFS